MKKTQISLIVAGIVVLVAVVGCTGDTGMTKEQEEALRHPVRDPNYKGPDPAAQAKMGASIAAFQARKKNEEKVQFKSGGG